MAGVLNCLAVTAKNIGQDVINGMRGDIGSFTKQYGERILKSNMTKQQSESSVNDMMMAALDMEIVYEEKPDNLK